MKPASLTRSLLGAGLVLLLGCVCFPSATFAQTASGGPSIAYRIPADRSGALASPAFNSFDAWYRYPAEEQYWLQMTSATAYIRDVLAGGQTYISGAADGESWSADEITPDGNTLTWGAVRFYSSYNGYQDCFVSPSWYICGGNSLYVLWYSNAQCQTSGTYTMNFYANDSRFYTGDFKLLPQIPPNKVPRYNQGAYLNDYDSICHATGQDVVFHCDGRVDEVPYTIKRKGCAMSSEAMILGYFGVSVDPATLNTWMINNHGYDLTGGVYWDVVARYAKLQGKTVAYLGASGDLDQSICRYGPQIINVHNGGHWVTATGQDEQQTTHLVNDPDGGVATTLAARYNNQYTQIRRYGGPEYTYTDITGIVIRFHSPGELLIADPQGRVTGFDPRTGQSYNEIPGSSYSVTRLDDDETGALGPETKELDIRQPAAGEYVLDVVGTGVGTYDLEINAYDPELNPSQAVFTDVPISAGELHSYAFDFQKTVGSTIAVDGGFDGGGQRPRDVNRFLSYGSPGESQTSLPAGTTQTTVLVFYGATVLPATFSATLNGQDVTALFQPVAGGSDRVTLDLAAARNVLKLSIDGELPNRVATDTDRLVFKVP